MREPEFFAPPANGFALVGRRVLVLLRNTGRAVLMMVEAFWYLPSLAGRRGRSEGCYQLYWTGVKSMGVITVVGLFTGMILALQTGLELRHFGQEASIGTAVTVVMLREMGPVMAGLIIAASVGSAIAAHLGTMTVSDEIAALELMSVNPVRFLATPRLMALMVVMPLLTLYANIIGIVGGAIVGATQLNVSFEAYFDNAFQFAHNKELYVGLFKAWVFGVIITAVSCHQGLSASGGALGVGRAVRRTVVISFLSLLVVGYIITRLFYQ